MPPDAASGSPRQELIRSSQEELGCELPLNHRERGRSSHSRTPGEPGSSSCQDRSFTSSPHQRLLACSAAAKSRVCFLLFRSEFALWSVGNQTPGSNACLCSALLQQTCKGVLLVWRQICPLVPPGSVAQRALETVSNGYSCWTELHLPDLIYSNKKHIHPFPIIYCL